MIFTFKTDEEAQRFCERIVASMVSLFSIPENEAIGRVNRHWQGQEIFGPTDIVYLEDEVYWAKAIYYENDTYWWLPDSPLKPKPYP